MTKNDSKRKDFEENHELITDAFLRYVEDHKKAPTIRKLAEITELAFGTVKKHIKSIDFKKTTTKYRLFTDDVILSLYHSAKTGNSASIKLYFQIIEGFNFNESEQSNDAPKPENFNTDINIDGNTTQSTKKP